MTAYTKAAGRLSNYTHMMKKPSFVDGLDETTFAPFVLIDCRHTEWKDVRLSFSNWTWLKETYRANTINDYYLNGYGIQGLVLAARVAAGLEAVPNGIEPNSEGDCCYLHFSELDIAVETASLAQEVIRNREKLLAMIAIAREYDLED